jgi:hypothetical protein
MNAIPPDRTLNRPPGVVNGRVWFGIFSKPPGESCEFLTQCNYCDTFLTTTIPFTE